MITFRYDTLHNTLHNSYLCMHYGMYTVNISRLACCSEDDPTPTLTRTVEVDGVILCIYVPMYLGTYFNMYVCMYSSTQVPK